MNRKWKVLLLAPVLLVAFVTLGGQVVMQLWNWLMPSIFGWKEIGFWQALGLLALCRILFGGGGMGGWRGRRRHRANREGRFARRWCSSQPAPEVPAA